MNELDDKRKERKNSLDKEFFVKYLAIIVLVCVLSSPEALATKARMLGLGQSAAQGSRYFDDSRNAFRNPAHIVRLPNVVVMEWADQVGANAEGGVFHSSNQWSYGAYFGAKHREPSFKQFENDSSTDYATDFASQAASFYPGNELDFFFGSKGELSWGVRGNIFEGKDNEKNSQSHGAGLGVGIHYNAVEAYLNLDLRDSREVDTTEYQGRLGVQLGVGHRGENWVFHGEYSARGVDVATQGQTGKSSAELSSINFLIANLQRHSSRGMTFTALDFIYKKWETNSTLTSPVQQWEQKLTELKATIGFEVDAMSWLCWRGSISQNVLLGEKKMDGTSGFIPAQLRGQSWTVTESTLVSAGASLMFGSLQVDGMLAGAANGNLSLSNLLANVGVIYHF
jgi:hypothetical protein